MVVRIHLIVQGRTSQRAFFFSRSLFQRYTSILLPKFTQKLGDEELKASIRIPNHPIDFKEFTALMERYSNDKNKDPEEPYRRAFHSINKDGSGHISSQELRAAIKNILGDNVLSEVS